MELLDEDWEYIPSWSFASPRVLNYGYVKCFFCTHMENMCPRHRAPLFIKELNTYKCLKYPEGIPHQIIIEKADIFEDMFHHQYCEYYDRYAYNAREESIRLLTELKNNGGPDWLTDYLKNNPK